VLNGLSLDKLLIVGVIAVFLLGPTRLPVYAKKLAALVKRIRAYASDAQERIREEMGPGFDDVDWKKLDPRQYDPRRIIREALFEDDDEEPQVRTSISAPSDDGVENSDDGVEDTAEPLDDSADPVDAGLPPYDREAT
jgi:sec-independent protein translocase protein TatB